MKERYIHIIVVSRSKSITYIEIMRDIVDAGRHTQVRDRFYTDDSLLTFVEHTDDACRSKPLAPHTHTMYVEVSWRYHVASAT